MARDADWFLIPAINSYRQATSLIWRLNLIALWALIATAGLFAGLMLRDWTWRQTEPIRFQGDITNALNIGRETVLGATEFRRGEPPTAPGWAAVWKTYLNRYDAEYARVVPRRGDDWNRPIRYRFDYPPGRLLIASAWAKHVVQETPPGQTRPRGLGASYSDDLVTPLRYVNIGHELAGALATFLLTRRILLNAKRGLFSSELLAMLAGLLVWFNPALILNAHGWPQWEAWVLPYTLFAAYFALIDRWLFAGALLAAGAMLKGQVLMFLPLLPLWAIFSWRWGALLRLTSGFLATTALLMSPWLLRDALPAIWAVGGAGLFAVFLLLVRSRRSSLDIVALAMLIGWLASPSLGGIPRSTALIVAGVATFLAAALYLVRRSNGNVLALAMLAGGFALVLPAALAATLGRSPPQWLAVAMPRWNYTNAFTLDAFQIKLVLGGLCAIGGVALVARRSSALPATLGLFAALVFFAGAEFNGSFAWLHVGFQTIRYDELVMGRVSNLAAILQKFHGLTVDTPVSDFGFLAAPMLLSPFLKLLATIGLALCALTFAIQIRRKDANALIAFAAAWTLLYALLPQMHERYLTWGAVVSAMLIARGIGGLLIHLTLTAIQFAMMLLAMSSSHGRGEAFESLAWWTDVFRGMHPAIGYVVITLAMVLLAWSFKRSTPREIVKRRAAVPQVMLQPGATSAAVQRDREEGLALR